MSKLLYAVLFLFFNSALATDSSETVIMLISKTTRGTIISKDIVIAGSDFLMVNAEKLSPSEVITQSPHIKSISTFPNKPRNLLLGCESGTFEHILKKGPLKKQEEGCLDSERYRKLHKSFQALKKDPLTN